MADLPEQQPLSEVLMDSGSIMAEMTSPMRADGSNSMDSEMVSIRLDEVWVPDFASEWMYCMVFAPSEHGKWHF